MTASALVYVVLSFCVGVLVGFASQPERDDPLTRWMITRLRCPVCRRALRWGQQSCDDPTCEYPLPITWWDYPRARTRP